MPTDFREKLASRLKFSSTDVPDATINGLESFFGLLRKWNRRISLTSFDLEQITEPMLDRLFTEPIVAARHVPAGSRIVDIGSGGGSPAIPMKLCSPATSLLMVESRTRKAAFLRDAVRVLGLTDTSVAETRAEVICARPEFAGQADVVTIRAVKIDLGLLTSLAPLLSSRGRIFLFAGVSGAAPSAEFKIVDRVSLTGASELIILSPRAQ